ncbi:ligase-associated DNA damage response endonuclease PdeM [Aliiroseovarius sp. PTFE2010]|uniref:ligase-associated DNA damage response endonuclease PdeM n=1 Tax=Aliiroseovarius sp. PTFE2010 TaxID=3417190 RepID=UPI003CF09B55
MNVHRFDFAGAPLCALPTGALWLPNERALVVSDLHLGKSERMARRGGVMLPPYETSDTMARLDTLIAQYDPRTVVCLGDSFDDVEAAVAVSQQIADWISRLQAGRRWIWIEGNHDAGSAEFGGTHVGAMSIGPLTFRHIADPDCKNEVSGHFHPKARLTVRGKTISRPCFVVDSTRIILPAFGLYTGGLDCRDAPIAGLMGPNACAILTGPTARAIPMPRHAA